MEDRERDEQLIILRGINRILNFVIIEENLRRGEDINLIDDDHIRIGKERKELPRDIIRIDNKFVRSRAERIFKS